MSKQPIVILTASKFLTPIEGDGYVENVLLEDDLLIKALTQQGFKVVRKSWDDTNFDWKESQAVIFRATWDIYEKIEIFKNKIALINQKTRLINAYKLILWSLDKHYLSELNEKGIVIPPTIFIPKGDTNSLTSKVQSTGWQKCILKPVIGATARHTYLFSANESDHLEDLYQNLIKEEGFMIQEFQESVLTAGEISLMVIGGNVTHAVIKHAKPGDFRVQDDFGGSVELHYPTSEAVALAEAAIQACPSIPSYARVDLLLNSNGNYCVSEVELIEPELFFRFHESAAETLARLITAN